MGKNPWIAALLNFLTYGGGYLYSGCRVKLGIGLLAVFLVMGGETILSPGGHFSNPFGTHMLSMSVLSLVLAYDAFSEASSNGG